MIRFTLLSVLLCFFRALPADEPRYTFSHSSAANSTSCVSCHNVGDDQAALEYYRVVQGVFSQMPRYQFVPYADYYDHQAGTIHVNKELMRAGGFLLEPLRDPILMSHLRLSDKTGIIVSMDIFAPNESTDDHELAVGDVIVAVNETPVSHPIELRTIADENPAAVWTVDRIRAGERKEARLSASLFKSPPKEYRLGVVVEPVSQALVSQLGIAGGGLLVTDVVEDSAASEAGVEMYDILVELADVQLSKVEDIRTANRASEGKEVSLSIIRDAKLKSLDVQPKEVEPSETASPPIYCPAIQDK
ncbi:MAG: PDZ domain-containing protein [Planctomycetota bacterium]